MKLSELLPRVARAVRSAVPDAPENMLLDDLAWSLASTFADTKLLTRDMTLDLQAEVADYLLDECPGDDLVWHEISYVQVNGMDYVPRPLFGPVTACYYGGRSVHWNREHHTITVRPTPAQDAPGALVLRMVVTPARSPDAEVPDYLAQDTDILAMIVAGAATRALQDMMPNAAVGHSTRYDALKTKVITRRVLGWAGASTETRMRADGFVAR